MPFFADRDTVMPAHLKEGGDFFSDTGTLHPSEGYSKKTKRSKHGKKTKKAVIWISVLLIALVGAAAASVCFFLHMGDIDKITSMINTGKIVLPAEDAHATHNGGLGKRAGPYGYHSIANASSVASSTSDVSSVASGTGSVFTETETSTLDTLLTQPPFTTVTRTTSVSYPASTTDDAYMSTVVVTSFVTEQPTAVETSPMGMATVTATVSQAPNVTTVTVSGSTVISTIVTQGSADAISGSPLIPTGPLGWKNSTASSAAGGLTTGSSTLTVTAMTTVTPCPFANTTDSVFGISSKTTSPYNNTTLSLGTTITSGKVVSGTTASTTPNSESTSTMSPTLSPLVSISYFTETITKISNVTRTGIPPVPITATSTETVYRSTYTSVVETTVTITSEESSAVVTPAATTVFVSATVLETILVTVSVPVTVGSCASSEALITSTQVGTVVPMPVVTPGQADTSSVAALDIPDAAITTSTLTDLPLVSVGPNTTVLITKPTDDAKTVLYFNGTSTTLTATTTPTANLVSTTEPATESTSPSGNPSPSDVTVDVTVTLFNPLASTTPSLNSTTLIPNGTTTVSIGMDMGTGIPLSTVVSTSIVRVNTTTSWTMPTMTMPVPDSAAPKNKPEPKWWGGSNGGGATTCTIMLAAIVAVVVM